MRPLAEVLRLSTGYLRSRGSPTPRLDAELLLAHALRLTRVELYTNHDRPLTEEELAACRALLERRGRREPVAYILGRWGFRGLDLAVDARVLVPRPETELVVERCLELLPDAPGPRVVDVGTGSGAIALAIAAERPDAVVTACDVDEGALALAAENAARLGLGVELVRSDLLAALDGRTFHAAVSNPPYVSERELAGLEPEVARWEPRVATVAGADGMAVLRRLAADAWGHLEPGGALVLECGEGQAGPLAAELRERGYAEVASRRDLAGVERIVSGRRP